MTKMKEEGRYKATWGEKEMKILEGRAINNRRDGIYTDSNEF